MLAADFKRIDRYFVEAIASLMQVFAYGLRFHVPHDSGLLAGLPGRTCRIIQFARSAPLRKNPAAATAGSNEQNLQLAILGSDREGGYLHGCPLCCVRPQSDSIFLTVC